MTIRINKKIPAPVGMSYPFHEMEIGDSAFFPNQPKGSQSYIAQAARYVGVQRGMKFKAKSVNGGVRIERVVLTRKFDL